MTCKLTSFIIIMHAGLQLKDHILVKLDNGIVQKANCIVYIYICGCNSSNICYVYTVVFGIWQGMKFHGQNSEGLPLDMGARASNRCLLVQVRPAISNGEDA